MYDTDYALQVVNVIFGGRSSSNDRTELKN